MKVLRFCEECLSVFDFFSYGIFERTTNQYLKYVNVYFFIFLPFMCLVSSFALIIFVPTASFYDRSLALAQGVFFFAMLMGLFCLFAQMNKIKKLHDELQEIVDDGKFLEKLVFLNTYGF